jgi:hypothetical protein
MRSSGQRPLESPKGLNSQDFKQALPDWEAAVFDDAVLFFVLYLRRPADERRFEFKTFREAVEHARSQADLGCVYAVTKSNRHALLDRVKWDEWLERQAARRVRLTRGA